jgi:aminotransferase
MMEPFTRLQELPTMSDQPAFAKQVISHRAQQVGATFPWQLSVPTPGMLTLAGGTPDFPTPPHVVEAGAKALRDGATTYTPWRGIQPLREAIVDKLLTENHLKVDPNQELLVSAGAQAAMMAVILATVNPGDEVIVPVPYYDEYRRDIMLAGGVVVPVPTKMENDFEVEASAIEAAITEKSKIIILISPSNPTGAVLRQSTLEQIAEIAKRHNLTVISDELYERFLYDDATHFSIASLPGMWERTIVINGFSKCYSMTGWRVGYVAANPDFINALLPIAHGMTICAPAVSQWGALAALQGPHDFFEDVLEEYGKRRALWMNGLESMGIGYGKPGGAYYIMFDVRSTGLTSQGFATAMRDEAKVLVGGGGGATDPLNEGFARGSFAVKTAHIAEGLERMAPVVAKYQAQRG